MMTSGDYGAQRNQSGFTIPAGKSNAAVRVPVGQCRSYSAEPAASSKASTRCPVANSGKRYADQRYPDCDTPAPER